MEKKDIQRLASFWEDFDVAELKLKYDKEGVEMSKMKEQSKTYRKKLSQQTRDFKKLEVNEKLQKIGGLIKNYQNGINRLTERAKKSEKLFVEIYNKMTTIVNPVPALKEFSNIHSGQDASQLLRENEKLKSQVSAFEKEFEEIENQEVTIRQLSDELERVRSENQSTVDSEFLVEFEAKLQAKDQEVSTLLEKLGKVEGEHESTVEKLRRMESDKVELQERYDMLASQLEIVQEESKKLTLEKNQFKHEVGRLKNTQGKGESVKGLELEILQRAEQVQKMENEVVTKNRELEELAVEVEKKAQRIKLLLAELGKVQVECNSRPTVQEFQEVRDRLAVMEKMQFSVNSSPGGGKAAKKMSIEQLLNQKIRAQQSKITRLNNSGVEKDQRLTSLTSTVGQLELKVAEREELVKKLENHIASIQKQPHLQGKSKSSSEDGRAGGGNEQKKIDVVAAENAGENVLKIVSEQRDRYRTKSEKMEEDLHGAREGARKWAKKFEKMQADNIKLFEKIRYIESYGTRGPGIGDPGLPDKGNISGNDTVIHVDSGVEKRGDDIEKKYKKLYEENLDRQFNPYNQFMEKEKKTQFQKLSALEKITLVTTGKMLRHKYGRMFLFFYALSLHILVFVMCYYFQIYR